MLSFFTIFTIATSLVSGLAIPHQDGSHEDIAKRGPSPLKLDFDVVKDTSKNSTLYHPERYFNSAKSKFHKRATPVAITDDKDISYILDVYLGSQQEKVTVLLDTGSSDLWVFGPGVSGAQGGTFDPSKSSDDTSTGEGFDISYLDGSSALGSYYKDDFSFSLGLTLVLDFQFAVVNQANADSTGILGIADKNQESGLSQYDNLPWALLKAGVTPKASYSLFLGSEQEGKGTVIFGGIDTDKYEGELQKYSLPDNSFLGLTVESADVGGKTIQLGQQFVFDSGTSWNLWPYQFLESVASDLGSTGEDQGIYIVDCNQPSDKSITFNLGKNSVSVPYSDLIIKVGSDSEPQCAIGAEGYYGQGPFILGDVFLRSAYVYYDLTDHTISIAQAKYSSSSNIISA